MCQMTKWSIASVRVDIILNGCMSPGVEQPDLESKTSFMLPFFLTNASQIGLKFTSCKSYPCKHFIFSHRIPRKANLQTTNYVQHSPPQKVTQLPSYHPFWPETSSLLMAFFPLPTKYLRNRVSSVSWWRRLGLIRIRRSRPWAFRRVWAVTLPLLAPFCRP